MHVYNVFCTSEFSTFSVYLLHTTVNETVRLAKTTDGRPATVRRIMYRHQNTEGVKGLACNGRTLSVCPYANIGDESASGQLYYASIINHVGSVART